MPELIQIEERQRMIRETCLGGTIKKAEVLDRNALRGLSPKELQETLANSRLVDVQHKGLNLLLFTDKGNMLVLTMQGGADVECQPAPVLEHSTDARVILHFDDDHTLDFRLPSLRDHFLFFPTTDVNVTPLSEVGPEARDISYEAFRDQMRANAHFTIFDFLNGQRYVSGLSPADIDEICFQARVRSDTHINHLLRTQVKTLYDKMQKILRRIEEVKGDFAQLDQFDFLMPRRGNDRGCPRDGSGLKVLHFDQARSYYCPKCQVETPFDKKRMCYW